jgi:hypothetical protein
MRRAFGIVVLTLLGAAASACPKDEVGISPAPDPVRGQAAQAAPAAAPAASGAAVEAAKIPLEAEIAKATAIEATKAKRYDEALVAADKAVSLAPEWAEAYLARARAQLAKADLRGEDPAAGSAKLSALEGTSWSLINFGDPQTWRFMAQGVLRCDGECPDKVGTWRVDGNSVRATLANGTLVGTLEDPTHLKGTGSDPTTQESWNFSGTLKEPGKKIAPSPKDGSSKVLEAAAADLESYLRLAPKAVDREDVLSTIGQIKVKLAK